MKKYILITVCLVIVMVALYYWKNPLVPTVRFGNTVIILDLAVTPKEIEKGLSGRAGLPPGRGMMFLFNHKEQFPFWMKDMNFPLDFIWMDGNQIKEISKNVPVTSDGKITRIAPSVPVDKVLEINAGEVDRYGLKVGDTAIFNK